MKLRRHDPKEGTQRMTKGSGQRIHNYYAAKKVERVQTGKRHAHVDVRLRSPVVTRVAVALFVIFVVFSVTVLSSEPIIVFRNGSVQTSVDRYAPKVQELLQSSVLNTNKLTLRRAHIERELLGVFPEVQSVDVESAYLGRRPVVYVSVYELPLSLSSQGRQYAITSSGKIAGPLADFPLADTSVAIVDESGVTYSVGDTVLRSDDVVFIETLISITKGKGVGLEQLRITDVPREIYVKPSAKPYTIRMYLDEDVYQQTGAWFAVEETVGEGSLEAARYIDVRAGEKVFWQ